MRYRINKQKCTGCQLCISKCPGATKIGGDGKVIITDQEKIEKCGGERVCPFGAIEKIGKEEKEESEKQETGIRFAPGQGRGMGRGMGAGRGRGLSIGPRDGRGMGRRDGGRRR